MNQVLSAISIVTKPIHSVYVKAFDANKYAAGIGFSSAITLALFFVMVILISLGDSGLREDTSVKLADVVMPERQIDTFLTEVDKPDKPEEQPEDIAQPELDLQPLTGIDVSVAKPKPNFKAGGIGIPPPDMARADSRQRRRGAQTKHSRQETFLVYVRGRRRIRRGSCVSQ